MSAITSPAHYIFICRQFATVETIEDLQQLYEKILAGVGRVSYYSVLVASESGSDMETLFGAQRARPKAAGAIDSLPPEASAVMESATPYWPPEGEKGSPAYLPLVYGKAVFGLVELGGLEIAGDLARSIHECAAAELASAIIFTKVREDLSARLTQNETRVRILTEMGLQLNTLDEERIGARLISVALRSTQSQVGAVLLRDAKGWTKTIEWGLREEIALKLKTENGDLAAEKCARTFKSLVIAPNPQMGHFAFIPISGAKVLVGVACLARSPNDPPYTEAELNATGSVTSLAAIAIENCRSHQESLEMERWRASVDLAREIHRGLMPASLVEVPGLDIAYFWEACETVGGDYLDLIPATDGHLHVVVGDVTGHGFGPSLLMSSTRAALRALMHNPRPPNLSVLGDLNEFLIANVIQAGFFVTMFIARIDPRSSTFYYSNAGHNAALIFDGAGTIHAQLEASALPLGIDEKTNYEQLRATLGPGQTLVVYTDGIPDARSPRDEMFGMERFTEAIRSQANHSSKLIVQSIRDALKNHMGETPLADDQTLIVLKKI